MPENEEFGSLTFLTYFALFSLVLSLSCLIWHIYKFNQIVNTNNSSNNNKNQNQNQSMKNKVINSSCRPNIYNEHLIGWILLNTCYRKSKKNNSNHEKQQRETYDNNNNSFNYPQISNGGQNRTRGMPNPISVPPISPGVISVAEHQSIVINDTNSNQQQQQQQRRFGDSIGGCGVSPHSMPMETSTPGSSVTGTTASDNSNHSKHSNKNNSNHPLFHIQPYHQRKEDKEDEETKMYAYDLTIQTNNDNDNHIHNDSDNDNDNDGMDDGMGEKQQMIVKVNDDNCSNVNENKNNDKNDDKNNDNNSNYGDDNTPMQENDDMLEQLYVVNSVNLSGKMKTTQV